MNIKETLLGYENNISDDTFIKKEGLVKVILTAPHTMKQLKSDGTLKQNEPFTKAICMYVANELNTYYLIKLKDTKIDSNSLLEDDFKDELISIINNNDIKLSLDIHGASYKHDFDIEIGTLDGKSASLNTIDKLVKCFNNNGINKISINEPFKGGGITNLVL